MIDRQVYEPPPFPPSEKVISLHAHMHTLPARHKFNLHFSRFSLISISLGDSIPASVVWGFQELLKLIRELEHVWFAAVSVIFFSYMPLMHSCALIKYLQKRKKERSKLGVVVLMAASRLFLCVILLMRMCAPAQEQSPLQKLCCTHVQSSREFTTCSLYLQTQVTCSTVCTCVLVVTHFLLKISLLLPPSFQATAGEGKSVRREKGNCVRNLADRQSSSQKGLR